MKAPKVLLAALGLAVAATFAGCGAEPVGVENEVTATSDEALTPIRLRDQVKDRLRDPLRIHLRDRRTVEPIVTICEGTPETIAGVVTSLGGGEGITIDTGVSEEVVFGLGPPWYWARNEVERPVVGDSVEVVVSPLVTKSVNVILTISVNDGPPLALRDAATCLPLW